ncbi:Tm-1-like ATP-binding domain-containing protein [Limnohabitans sp. Rim8]|jgi:uncharacterized protein (UPF0261 family)|uniref:Tm-1-like ATP-binding domain-containing protein n=1 Tax=Limnohabitans sp. Rim8 TaxID=1100718 RepID=UPI0025E53B77|nr:Tm-1-like ATP-binding domain-containing protein [Limnohabitans sp. Rim8]
MKSPIILIVGTVDTKSDEIGYLREQVLSAGGQALIMDVGVLAKGQLIPDIANTAVAAAAGVTLQQVMDSGDENSAMALMAQGASALAAQLQREGRMDGLLVLGGTMGTDLALDVASSLPMGVPKVVLSTVAFSPLLPPERMPPDLMMVLWAGGLYGLNSLCQSALAQAAGAVVGACRVARVPRFERPVVGMTSLGSSCLKYMVQLQPELDKRGFDLAVFHTTGMGGRAFESLAAQGQFACVMDFSLQEMVNQLGGSVVSAGPDRLMGAGLKGVPMLVAPGATDLVDYPAWGQMPERFAGRPSHDHNRLIASVTIDADMRREFARQLSSRLRQACGPVHLLLPLQGIQEWDRPGAPLHDPEGLAVLMAECSQCDWGAVEVSHINAHINDAAFVHQVLAVFDDWLDRGLVKKAIP